MPENHIAAALRAAARAACCGNNNCINERQGIPCGAGAPGIAAAVAAFLRRISERDHVVFDGGWRSIRPKALHALAAAVEQEARNDR